MRLKILLGVGILALLAMTVSQAQLPPGPIQANIPFPFVAEGKTLPAGQYTFTVASDETTVEVRGATTADTAVVPIITRLGGAFQGTWSKSHIVFDEVGRSIILSELWIPGMDGYMLHITRGKHTHRAVTVTR